VAVRRFLIWFWKEVRGHRGFLIAFAVAIPGLTFLAGFVFPALFRSGSPLADLRTDLFFLTAAAALVVLAVAGDLFSREHEEGTIGLVRRLPGALAPVFAAKVAFLVSVTAAAVLWQAGTLVVAWSAFGRITSGRNAFDLLLGALTLFPLREPMVRSGGFDGNWLLAVAVLAAWGLMGSTWSLRGGVALGAGAVLLGLLVAPYVALDGWEAHAAYRESLGYFLIGGLAAIALVAAAWSFLGGARYVRGPWPAVLRGGMVLLVSAGAAHAWVAGDRADLFDLRPGRRGVTVQPCGLGSDGRYLFLTSSRDIAALRQRLPEAEEVWFRQAFVVDLATGRARALGDAGSCVTAPTELGLSHTLDPVARVTVSHRAGDRTGAVQWIDARTAQPLRLLAQHLTTEETVAWTREDLALRTPHRDVQGRPVWLRWANPPSDVAGAPRDLRREWQEGTLMVSRPVGGPTSWAVPMHGGWYLFGSQSKQLLTARRGDVLTWDSWNTLRNAVWPVWVGEDVALLRGSQSTSEGPHARWRLVSLATRTAQELPNPPIEVVTDVGPDALLVTRRAEGRLVISVWNPLTGEDRPCAWVTGDPPSASGVGCRGSRGDGRRVLELMQESERNGAQPMRRHTVTALFEPTSAQGPTLRLLRTASVCWPIALRDDGALLVFMPDQSGVEWWGPAVDQVERIPFRTD
jgi:hypothetical protein